MSQLFWIMVITLGVIVTIVVGVIFRRHDQVEGLCPSQAESIQR